MTTANSMSTATAGHLTRAQILTELGHKFHAPDIAEGDDITDYVEGPIEALNSTERTQPAMLAAGVATYRLWRDRGGAADRNLTSLAELA